MDDYVESEASRRAGGYSTEQAGAVAEPTLKDIWGGLAAPFDAILTPGFYANATRWPFQATGVPGLSVTGNSRGSNTLTGNFTVGN